MLAPAEALLADKAVWFVLLDGPLESLPLTLLLKTPTSAASASHDWRQLTWSGAPACAGHPAIGGCTALARSEVPPAPAPEALVAFADPVLGPTGKEGTRAVRKALTRGLWGEHRLADPTRLRMLPPLPETADEARAVAATLGGGQVFLREETSESNVKDKRPVALSQCAVCHPRRDGQRLRRVWRAGLLVMTPPAVANSFDDGLLSANEIANLKLNADWVLLSACNTAAADWYTRRRRPVRSGQILLPRGRAQPPGFPLAGCVGVDGLDHHRRFWRTGSPASE